MVDISADNKNAAPVKAEAEYYTVIAKIKDAALVHESAVRLTINISPIDARLHPRIVSKTGSVYVFPRYHESQTQLLDWVIHATTDYINMHHKNSGNIAIVEAAVNAFIEKLLWEYAEHFSLVRMYAKDLS